MEHIHKKPALTEGEARRINNEAVEQQARQDAERRQRAASESGKAAVENADDVISEIDEILNDIDEVLEANAEEFVRSFVQKGGE